MRWTRRSKRGAECASDGDAIMEVWKCGCRTTVPAFPAPRIFLCRFLRPSKAVPELGWCCADRLRKDMPVRSRSKIARTRVDQKRAFVCPSPTEYFYNAPQKKTAAGLNPAAAHPKRDETYCCCCCT